MSGFPQDLNDFANALDRCKTGEEVWKVSCALALEAGFDKVSYHAVRPAAVLGEEHASLHIKTTGYPEAWLQHYLDNNLHRVDPITQRALVSTAPFQWSEVTGDPDLEPRGRQFARELKAAGVGDGVALQAFGPNLRSAYVGLGFAKPPEAPLTQEQLRWLTCAAHLAHLAVCRIDDGNVNHGLAQLSPREIEVLTVMAQGLSTVQIARQLDVSRHTVDALQRRIYTKLEVTDRTSAVVHGLAAGVIQAPVVHPIRQRFAKKKRSDPPLVS